MTISYIIFSSALVLLGGFVLFKQRELSRGTTSGMTATLAAHSPRAEAWYGAFITRVRALLVHGRDILRAILMRAWHAIRTFVRHLVVLFAAKMVKAVRGEKLLYGNGAPSLYLKRLGVEMQNGDDLKPEDVREEFVRRVEIKDVSAEEEIQQ